MRHVHFFLTFCFALCCSYLVAQTNDSQSKELKYLNPEGMTVGSRYAIEKAGEGYHRKNAAYGSFEYYILNLPMKPVGYKTHLHNGEEKSFDVQIGVLDLKISGKNSTCSAEGAIKIRAEYLFSANLYGRIHFNFNNGFNCSYAKWAAGFRVNDTKNGWIHSNEQDYSRKNFLDYLDVVFQNTTIPSLAREMSKVELYDVKAGDLLIQSGYPNHAAIVLDVLYNDKNNTIKIMLAQGFSPAQEIEVLKNYQDDCSPWFTIPLDSNENTEILTPQWTFYVKDFKRFTN